MFHKTVIGVSLESLGKAPKAALETAAGLGVDCISITAVGLFSPSQIARTGRRELIAKLNRYELQIAAIACGTRSGIDETDRLDARLSHIEQCMELAAELRTPMVTNLLGEIPESRENSAHFWESLDRIVQISQKTGVCFAFELGWNKPDSAESLLKQYPKECLQLCYDPSAVQIRGFHPVRTLQKFQRSVGLCRIQDLLRTGSSATGFREAPLGDGEMDFSSVAIELTAMEYQGAYICHSETFPIIEKQIAKIRKQLSPFQI